MSQLTAEPPDAAERYAEDGVVLLRQLIPPNEIEEIRRVFTDRVETDRSLGFDDHLAEDDILSRYPRFVHPHRHPELEAGRLARRLMTDRRLFEVVTDLLGPDYGAQSMFYFQAPDRPGPGAAPGQPLLQAHPETCLAAWIAVDDCDAGLRAVSTFQAWTGVAAVRTFTTVSVVEGAEPLTLWAVTSLSTGAVVSDDVAAVAVWRGWRQRHAPAEVLLALPHLAGRR